jgi:hypothetical protein
LAVVLASVMLMRARKSVNSGVITNPAKGDPKIEN